MDLDRIKKDEIQYVWTALVPFMERFAQIDSYKDLYRALCEGHLQCWISTEYEEIQSLLITKIAKSSLHIVAATGLKPIEQKNTNKTLEAFAKKHGCDLLSLEAREGYKRVFDEVAA